MRVRLANVCRRIATLVVAAVVASAVSTAQQAGTALPAGAPGQIAPSTVNTQTPEPPASSRAIIRGRVLRADNSRPLEGVRVQASSGGVAFTDAEGRYELRDVLHGDVLITASRDGFITLAYGQRRPTDPVRRLQPAAGQLLQRIDFALVRGGVIAGTVIDTGEVPVELAGVFLFRERFQNGERFLVPVSLAGGASRDLSDDLGEFRLHGVPPGTYYLVASPPVGFNAMSRSMATLGTSSMLTFFPGTRTRAAARPVTIEEGEEVAGLIFTLLPLQGATLRGTVTAPAGAARPSILTIRQLESGLSISQSAQIAADGSFIVPNLAAGTYVLTTRVPGYAAMERVSVDRTDRFVTMALTTGWKLNGRIVFEDGAPASLSPTDVGVFATGSLAGTGRGTVSSDWTFEIPGLLGTNRIDVRLPAGWGLKRIVRRASDITDARLELTGNISDVEIVLSQRLTTIAGVVRDESGRPTSEAVVLVFADEPIKWSAGVRYIRRALPDREGRVDLHGLPDGSYSAVAIQTLEAGDEFDPDVLQRLLNVGTRFTLREGETRALDLKVSTIP
jgi:hypothetical protein